MALVSRPIHKKGELISHNLSKDYAMMGMGTSILDMGFGQDGRLPSSIVTVRSLRKIK
jgi:hypothetical protein